MHFSKSSAAIFLSVALIFGLLISCRTTEKIPVTKLRPMNSIRLYKKAEENTFDYHHFNIKKINIQYEKGETKTSFRASFLAVKDSSIIISITKLNILLVRVMLTPDSVFYVNYFNKTYYSGDYTPVSKLLNFNLNFNTVQAIAAANIFLLFENEKELREFDTWVENGMYVLQSEDVRKLSRMEDKGKTQRVERFLKRIGEDIRVIQTFYFDPDLFTIRKLVMADQTNQQKASLEFNDYEQIGDKYFPSSVNMLFLSNNETLTLSTKMSGFSTETGEFIPLRIPDKYQRIYIN